MKLVFKNNTPVFQNFLAKMKAMLLSDISYEDLRKELKSAYHLSQSKNEDIIKLLYVSENISELKKILFLPDFNPQSFELTIPVAFLSKLSTGAVVTIDKRPVETGGLGKYVCDHTACIINSFKLNLVIKNLKINGFVHIPEYPDFEQLAEVLGTGISEISETLNKKNIRIMLTGFTQFGTVKDNATGHFLFGDGISNEFSGFGFLQPTEQAVLIIDRMVEKFCGKYISSSVLEINGISVGRQYIFSQNKKIELILVRLPVDTDLKPARKSLDFSDFTPEGYKLFMKNVENNIYGDRVQDILEYTAKLTQPDTIISLGVNSFLPSEFYEIETEIFGLDSKYSNGVEPLYLNNLGKGRNYELAEVYEGRG